MLHKNPLSTFQTGLCRWDRWPADTFYQHIGSTRWFVTANLSVSLIERDNVITEVGAQDFAFSLSCALVQIWAGPETPAEERTPLPLFSQPLSLSVAPSCCVPLSLTAPDGLLFSGCSLTSILRGHFLFFFSPSVDLSPADSLSRVNSSLFQLCLQPALGVWLTTLGLSPAANGLLFFVLPLTHAVFGSHA